MRHSVSAILPHPHFGRVHWAFSGGVFKGAAFPGAVEALLDRDVLPESISTVSVSSLSMAPLAGAQTKEDFRVGLKYILRRWQDVEIVGPEAIFPKFLPSEMSLRELRRWWKKLYVWNAHGIASNEPLYDLIRDFDPHRAVRRNGVRMRVGVYRHDGVGGIHELVSFQEDRFDPERGGDPSLLPHFIVASASPEPIFAPVEIGGAKYADGDMVDLEPILRDDCPDTIFLFLCYPQEQFKVKQRFSLLDSLPLRGQRFAGFMLRHFPFATHFVSHYVSPTHEAEEALSVAKAEYLAEVIRLTRENDALRSGEPGTFRFPRIVRIHLPIPDELVQNEYSFSPGTLTDARIMARKATERILDDLLGQQPNPS